MTLKATYALVENYEDNEFTIAFSECYGHDLHILKHSMSLQHLYALNILDRLDYACEYIKLNFKNFIVHQVCTYHHSFVVSSQENPTYSSFSFISFHDRNNLNPFHIYVQIITMKKAFYRVLSVMGFLNQVLR